MLIIKTFIFFIILILCAYYDLKKMIVPDFLTYPGIILGLAFAFLSEKSICLYYLIGGAGGFIITILIFLIGKYLLKKEIIGGGDIKLVTVIGLFAGYTGLLLTFILSSFSGIITTYIIYKDLKRPVPYAFYLSLAAIIVYIFLLLPLSH